MAANSSSNSSNPPLYDCSHSRVSLNISNAITVIRTVLSLPLGIFILYLGHQRWRSQRSFKTTSHSDIFTYHLAAMSLIWGLGCFCNVCGTYSNLPGMMTAGVYANSFVFYGEACFNVLTCVERYLAVVHPIVYLGLKNARGARIRNISIGCVWFLSIGWMGVVALYLPGAATVPFLCILVFYSVVVSFCSLSSLRVLIRPGPGDGGGEKKNVDQSKQRAFNTITAIAGVLWLWFTGLIVCLSLYSSPLLSYNVRCIVLPSAGGCNLPSSLVLPLLYLHRAGKLSCC